MLYTTRKKCFIIWSIYILYIIYFNIYLCIMDIQLMFIISCVYVNIYIYVHAWPKQSACKGRRGIITTFVVYQFASVWEAILFLLGIPAFTVWYCNDPSRLFARVALVTPKWTTIRLGITKSAKKGCCFTVWSRLQYLLGRKAQHCEPIPALSCLVVPQTKECSEQCSKIQNNYSSIAIRVIALARDTSINFEQMLQK